VDKLLMHNDEITLMVDLAICLTLVLEIIFAKFIGCTLPILAKKVGFDPAVMSSPFITTIVDAVSLLIYFGMATLLIPGLS
ncbi:MAG: magnesium transporter, partial [Clostridiales bacterium]|nr:magnesium transporter [Clostridiales bacterium]